MSLVSITRKSRIDWASRALLGGAIGVTSGALLLGVMGAPPLDVLRSIVTSVQSPSLISDALIQATPILLLALGTSLCFQAGFWNIGGEGYFYAGAIAAMAVGLNIGLPSGVLLALMAVTAALIGGALSWTAAVLRVRRGANEVVVTLMFNLVMIQIVSYAVRVPLSDPASRLAFSERLPAEIVLPSAHLLSPRVHVGVYLAMAITFACAYVLHRTAFGQSLRVVGENPDAALATGTNVARITMIASAALGVLGGLAGMVHVAGATQQLYVGLSPSPGFGYIAIMTALLGGLKPLGVMLSTLFYAVLSTASDTLQVEFGIPQGTITMFFIIVLLSILAVDTVMRGRGEAR
jgi:simple sugar transport system permease protein